MSQDPLQLVGKTLAGHFRVEHLVGEGAHSLVYRGIQIGPEVPVALKCLKVDLALSASDAETFLKNFREANKAAARFARGDAGFARSIGSGMTTVGSTYILYLVLEWIDGKPLRDELVERRKNGMRGRPFEEAARILAPIAQAIGRAHETGLVHGDVCPGNVLVSPTGEIRILDLSVSLHLEQLSQGLRSFSHIYAAPERLKGGPITPAQDVYSLGAMLFELLTDRPPMEAANYEEAARFSTDDGLRPNASRVAVPLSPPAKELVVRSLSKRPEERAMTAQAFAALLTGLIPKTSVPSRPNPIDASPLPKPSGPRPGTPASGVMKARLPLPEDATPTSEILQPSKPAAPADPLPPSPAPNLPSPNPPGLNLPHVGNGLSGSGPQVVARPAISSSARIKVAPRSIPSEGGSSMTAMTVPNPATNAPVGDLPSVIVSDVEPEADKRERLRRTSAVERPRLADFDLAGATSPRILREKPKAGKVALLTFLGVLALGGLFAGLYLSGMLDGLLRGRK